MQGRLQRFERDSFSRSGICIISINMFQKTTLFPRLSDLFIFADFSFTKKVQHKQNTWQQFRGDQLNLAENLSTQLSHITTLLRTPRTNMEQRNRKT